MARSRNIKPGLFRNEILGVADPIYTLAFQGLWLIADKEGRLEDRPLRINADIFPYRKVDIESVLKWLSDNGFIYRYMYGKNRYIQIVNFHKHQNPHKNEQESVIPAYTGEVDTNPDKIGTPTESIGSTRADSLNLIPDSLIPDSLFTPTECADEPPAGEQLFTHGLQILTSRNVKEKNARSFIGGMRKHFGSDIKAMQLLLVVDERDISDPLAWLTACMNRNGNREYTSQRDKLAATGAALSGTSKDASRVFEGTAVEIN